MIGFIDYEKAKEHAEANNTKIFMHDVNGFYLCVGEGEQITDDIGFFREIKKYECPRIETVWAGRLGNAEYKYETSTPCALYRDKPHEKRLVNAHVDRFYMWAPSVIGKRVLNVGSGFGYGTKIMSKFAREVVGIDIDKHELELPRINHSGSLISLTLSAK